MLSRAPPAKQSIPDFRRRAQRRPLRHRNNKDNEPIPGIIKIMKGTRSAEGNGAVCLESGEWITTWTLFGCSKINDPASCTG